MTLLYARIIAGHIALAAVAYEAWALLNRLAGDTWSDYAWLLSRWEVVPIGCGLVTGHWFGREDRTLLLFVLSVFIGARFWK